jgi:predicted DCC family thiol-disulfide oxidoreductase YuxK
VKPKAMCATTTPVLRGEKFLTYDGDCPMCTATVALLVRWRLVNASQTHSNHDLEPQLLELAQAAGIRNQLVVIDPANGTTRTGVDGLLWLVQDTHQGAWWPSIAGLPGIRHLLQVGYEIVSYNRRIISPPKQRIRCDCEPQATVGRRLSLIVPATIAAAGLLGVSGAGLFRGLQIGDARSGAVAVVLAAALPWVMLAVAAAIGLRGEQRIDAIAHLAVTALVGAVLLSPVTFAWWLAPTATIILAALATLASAGQMFRMQRKRVPAAGLSERWLAGWVATVAVSIVAVVAVCLTRLSA